VISQFLTEMDGIEELKGVIVLAATNRMDIIDPALLRNGRFDLLFELPVPDLGTRLSIFKIHTKNKPLDKGTDLKTLAGRTDGWVGSDIEALCRRASMSAIRRYIAAGKKKADAPSKQLVITRDDFDTAMKSVHPERP
jgi:transitional endoplasmic reticulum ATPase